MTNCLLHILTFIFCNKEKTEPVCDRDPYPGDPAVSRMNLKETNFKTLSEALRNVTLYSLTDALFDNNTIKITNRNQSSFVRGQSNRKIPQHRKIMSGKNIDDQNLPVESNILLSHATYGESYIDYIHPI